MSRVEARRYFEKQTGDPAQGWIQPEDPQHAVDVIYRDMEQLAASSVGARMFAANAPYPTAQDVPSPRDGDLFLLANGDVQRYDGVSASPGWVKVASLAATATTGGDVKGPASSVDSVIATFDGTTGKLLKSSSGIKAAGNNLTPVSGKLLLNYGGGGFDAVRSGQLNVVRDGVGDGNSLFCAYRSINTADADSPVFEVKGIGTTLLGRGEGSVHLKLQGAAGRERQVQFMSGYQTRWTFGATPNVEPGDGSGSDFSVARYDDAGNWKDNPIDISRKTGVVSLGSLWIKTGGSVTNLPEPTQPTDAATKRYVDTKTSLIGVHATFAFSATQTATTAANLRIGQFTRVRGDAPLKFGDGGIELLNGDLFFLPVDTRWMVSYDIRSDYGAAGQSGLDVWCQTGEFMVSAIVQWESRSVVQTNGAYAGSGVLHNNATFVMDPAAKFQVLEVIAKSMGQNRSVLSGTIQFTRIR